ncbi:MAG: MotA/TolQ/ExbB proton channel family protein [Synergistaceae bacterium]|nr:MotA/TolQ/ExbB proton channel family protein [Synergistaceae bacterium]
MIFSGFDFGSGYVAFMEYMRAGGTIMWVILGISIATLAIVIERFIFFAMMSVNATRLEEAFVDAMSENAASARQKMSLYRSSLGRLFEEAAANWNAAGDDLKNLLESGVRRELYKWQGNLHLIETAAKVSPLLGLLGTVLGMVEMFQTLSAGSAIDPAAVTGGIWKALFTTVAGLMVAIPAIMIHGLLSARIGREEEKLLRGMDFIMREHTGRG